MSAAEKRTWIAVLVGAGVPAAYLATILSRVPGSDVASIAYVRPMLVSIAAG